MCSLREWWQVASPYLDQALGMPEEERESWLVSLREQNPGLAGVLQILIAEHRALAEEHFLEENPDWAPGPAVAPGEPIGAYTLVSPIGQGGMGSVWAAERSDARFERRAAVKFLNSALADSGGRERFKREGRILGRLSHPNIAELLDAGVSPNGQPYLLLEYVEGEPIDSYCDRRNLDVEARVRLFLDLLGAIAYAHANFVVHRDIKPSNVLVRADGQLKLLDFGIAKLLDNESASPTTLLTREGAGPLTPEYAAPEQVTGGAVTTATDIYALGVLLYVLLTGQHPAGGGRRSPAELIKAIVETEAPRPSEVVKGPDKVRRSLQGDLDSIVAKALKKDPRDRYFSVTALAEDIGRYLRQQPISTRRDSLAYRTARYVRRHRTAVSLAMLACALSLAGVVGTMTQARPARGQVDFALRRMSRVILRTFGGKSQDVIHVDLTGASGAPLAVGNPFGYFFDAKGVQNVVFRTGDGHVHELWRKGAATGHSDLTSLANAPAAAGDPKAYVFAPLGMQNLVYRGIDGHLHGLFWSTGAVGHDDLTAEAHAPGPAGDPAVYIVPDEGLQNVVYRGTDGRLHRLFWSTGAVGHADLMAASSGPAPAGNPAAYFMRADGTHHVIYRSGDGHLHELWWTTGPVGHNDLTVFSGAPAAAGDPAAYFAHTYGLQNVVYRGTDSDLHRLQWTTGVVSHDNLTTASNAPVAASDPAVYFNAANGTHHVIYRSGDGHLRELWWTTGTVTHNDLTMLGAGPIADSVPSAYSSGTDGDLHIIYPSGDAHLHDLWSR
jgi:serine/threonine protein kinase